MPATGWKQDTSRGSRGIEPGREALRVGPLSAAPPRAVPNRKRMSPILKSPKHEPCGQSRLMRTFGRLLRTTDRKWSFCGLCALGVLVRGPAVKKVIITDLWDRPGPSVFSARRSSRKLKPQCQSADFQKRTTRDAVAKRNLRPEILSASDRRLTPLSIARRLENSFRDAKHDGLLLQRKGLSRKRSAASCCGTRVGPNRGEIKNRALKDGLRPARIARGGEEFGRLRHSVSFGSKMIPQSIKQFVKQQSTKPVKDLVSESSEDEPQVPYTEYWRRAIAAMLLSGRVKAKVDGAPNMADA